MTKNRSAYLSQYNKENYKMYPFRVKKSETMLISMLDSISNRNAYIRELILEDVSPSVLTIKQIKERIKPVMERHHIKDIYLFGSYARGEAHRSSDVDIYCDRGDVKTLWEHSAFEDELKDALGKDVDVIFLGSQMDDYFKTQLEEDKIKLC